MISGLLLFAIILGLAVVAVRWKIIKAFLLSLLLCVGFGIENGLGLWGFFFHLFPSVLEVCVFCDGFFLFIPLLGANGLAGRGVSYQKVLLISLWSLFIHLGLFF